MSESTTIQCIVLVLNDIMSESREQRLITKNNAYNTQQ